MSKQMLCLLLLQVLNADNLQPIMDMSAQPTLIAVAVHFPAKDRGTVRLIDNTVL
jgi:pantothenate synthetase